MFTTVYSYYMTKDVNSKLSRILDVARKAESLGDIDIPGFNKIVESKNESIDGELVHKIESIIEYFDLFFTLRNYVDQISDLTLDDFKDNVVDISKYSSVRELLMKEYGMPSVKQVIDSNYNMELVESSRQLLIDIIKKKRTMFENRIYTKKLDLYNTQDDIEIDGENMVNKNSVTFDGEHEWTRNEIRTKINQIKESYDLAMS